MFHAFVLVACLAVAHAGYAAVGYTPFYSGYQQPIQQIQPPVQYQAYQSFLPQQQYIPQVQVQAYNAFPAFPTPHSFGYHQSFPQQYIYHTATSTVQETTPIPTPSTSTTSNDDADEKSTTTIAPSKDEDITTTATPATSAEYDDVEQDDDSVITNAAFRSGSSSNTNTNTNTNTNSNFNSNSNSVSVSEASVASTDNFDNFRGFAYRNEFEGGRSHFVFITGPEAYRFPQSARAQPEASQSSRTSASDAVDSVAATTRSSQPDHSLDALINYLEHPQLGLQRFYSVNNALVARRYEDEIPAQPALPTHYFAGAGARNSLPITQPISPLFPLLRSSFQLDVDTAKPEDVKIAKDSKDSKVEDTKEQDDEDEESASSSTTSTTPASTSTSTTTTEKAKRSIMQPIIVE